MKLIWTEGELGEGLRCYRAQEFFAAHEHWECVWLRSKEPEKTFLQGLEKWSNQARMEGEEARNDQERSVEGTRQSKSRWASPRTKAKMHFVRVTSSFSTTVK